MQKTALTKAILLLLFIHILIAGKTQEKQKTEKDDSPSSNTRSASISLIPDSTLETFSLPFSKIQIRDVRPDTSKIGYSAQSSWFNKMGDGSMSKIRKVCVENGFANAAATFLNAQYHKGFNTNTQDQLLICIKKCWFSDFDSSFVNQLYGNKSLAFSNERLYFKAEMYLISNGSYYPMYRFDSVFNDEINKPYKPVNALTNALALMINRLKHTDFTSIKQRRAMSEADVESFNTRLIDAPVFKVAKPIKGVYMSFDEFKNNRPAYTDYEIKFGKLTDELDVKSPDGKSFTTQAAWGVCDGEDIYIKLGRNFFKLYPMQKTWEFFGTGSMYRNDPDMQNSPGVKNQKDIYHYETNQTPNGPETFRTRNASPLFTSTKLGKLYPYQVDIETGAIY